MFAIIGIPVVFGSIIGGFLMEKRNLPVLVQPAELVIIGRAAFGACWWRTRRPPIKILKKASFS